MKFNLKVRMDNAAFEDEGELGRILTALAQSIHHPQSDLSGKVRDINGNTVGEWAIT